MTKRVRNWDRNLNTRSGLNIDKFVQPQLPAPDGATNLFTGAGPFDSRITAGKELFAEISLNVKFPVDFLDGDAFVVTAVVRVDEELVGIIGFVLHKKLLVSPVDINLHLVLAAFFDAGESGIAVSIADLHRQPMVGVIDDHSRNLGIHL